jgi:hypothetical protein
VGGPKIHPSLRKPLRGVNFLSNTLGA